jgi:putative flavoprotein involved in K+ transport
MPLSVVDETAPLDCVVVGAGPAGLAMSEALTARGVRHQVLERGEVGNSWRTQRWAGLLLNSPGWLNTSLHTEDEPDRYLPVSEMVERLDAIAATCPVRTRTPVLHLTRSPAGFAVLTPSRLVLARSVVVASGDANVPTVPAMAARFPSRIRQLHSAQYRSPADLAEGGVLVVGSGQSGAQIAEELRAAGRPVVLATSPAGRVPLRRRGADAVAVLVAAGFFAARTETVPPVARTGPQPLLAPGHDLSLGRLAVAGVALRGRLVGVTGETVHFDGSLPANVAAGEALADQLYAIVDEWLARKGPLPPVPAEEREPSVTGPGDGSLDLSSSGIGTVLWCTGYGGDFSWMDPGLLDEQRGPRRQGFRAVGAAGLYYIGLRWLTMRGSGNFLGFPTDAAAIADAVVTDLANQSRPRLAG